MLVLYRAAWRFEVACGLGFRLSLVLLINLQTHWSQGCFPVHVPLFARAQWRKDTSTCADEKQRLIIRNMLTENYTWPLMQRVTRRGQGNLHSRAAPAPIRIQVGAAPAAVAKGCSGTLYQTARGPALGITSRKTQCRRLQDS